MKWTKRLADLLMSCKSDEELKENFPNIKLESLRRQQRKVRGGKEKSIWDFISKGKTMVEIQHEFGMTEESIVKELKNVPDGFDLFETFNFKKKKIYVLVRKIAEAVKIKQRDWKFTLQPDGQPYMLINFPNFEHLEKIKILPIADLHYGAHEFNAEKFADYVKFIKDHEHIYCFLAGDIFENCNGESNRGVSIFDQEVMPNQQKEDIVHLLAPIAHKILWAVPGNHENRSRKFDFDPLEYVASILGIPYFDEPIYVDVVWKNNLFTFFCQHGRSGSLTEGGKLNAASRPLEFQEHVHFTIMAHVHDAKAIRPTRIVRDRENFKLILKKQYVIICPAFLDYFGSYAARAAMKPGAWGTIACELYASGDYHAST